MNNINWQYMLGPYEQAVDEVTMKFTSLQMAYIKLNQHSPIQEVSGRVKSISSILDKANRKGIAYHEITKKIEDIAGVRIICKFVEDILILVQFIKDNMDALEIVEEKNYIENIKESGYRSYHILCKYNVVTPKGKKTVNVELQIRTMAMNFWATIEHSIRYKYSRAIPENIRERLVSSAEAAFLLDKEMGKIRYEIVEAEEMVIEKENLVKSILSDLEKLMFKDSLESAQEFNQKFFEIYEVGDIKEIREFSEQLKVITQLYNN